MRRYDRRRSRSVGRWVDAVSRREAWLSAGAVFAIALVVRAVAAAAVSFPVPENTAYYAGVARNLVEGRGLISDSLWSYGTPPLAVPRAAFEVWMPLPSLLAAIPMAIAGAANWFRAAQVASVLVSSAVAVLAWRLGADVAAELGLPVGRARAMAVGSGLVAAGLGPLVIFGALPDSTALFAALSLAACLLMTRIAARETAAPLRILKLASGRRIGQYSPDLRLIGLGLLLGLAALTRSEAIWLGLSWAAVVWFWTPGSRRRRIILIATPAIVAGLVFAPWLARNALVFGSPLPGQTISNAFFIHDYDVFAYQSQPSLAAYLGQGPVAILGQHLGGIAHNLVNVLVIPAFPVGILGLLALPWSGRRRALRPLVLTAVLTFSASSLLFPVATTSGTFLHAAGATYVLLEISCLVALDLFLVRVGRLRHWTRPVAWIGPALAIAAILPLCIVTVTTVAGQANDVRTRYEALPAAMARAGVSLETDGPVITDNPIWLAESTRVRALALPQESPDAVLALAHRFGAKILVVRDDGARWPSVLVDGGTAALCFQEVPLSDNSGRKVQEGTALAEIHVFRIVCP
jgi:hypothetical protein